MNNNIVFSYVNILFVLMDKLSYSIRENKAYETSIR